MDIRLVSRKVRECERKKRELREREREREREERERGEGVVSSCSLTLSRQ